jgi:hypothetical protein
MTLDEETDADLTKTPWVLVLNYVHKGRTDPALNVRDTTKGLPVLPETGRSLDFDTFDINATIEDGSVSNPGSWGHTNNDLFDKVCIALGSTVDANNGCEIRFLAKVNAHARIIHFKTTNANMIKEFRYGDVPFANNTETFTNTTQYNASYQSGSVLPIHSAFLPASTTGLFLGSGDTSMTEFPFFKSGTNHWSIGAGTRWEVDSDDALANQNQNTYHQIWVRADKA